MRADRAQIAETTQLVVNLLESLGASPTVHVSGTGTRYVDFSAHDIQFQIRVSSHPSRLETSTYSIDPRCGDLPGAIVLIRRIMESPQSATQVHEAEETRRAETNRVESPGRLEYLKRRIAAIGGVRQIRTTIAAIEARLALPRSNRDAVIGERRAQLRGEIDAYRRLLKEIEEKGLAE